ncbi:MAG: hypothetical protein IAF94_08610 [Pirellulaceae bacterium]|nr:hypothetical protein [Pirellulaceae bacterium]
MSLSKLDKVRSWKLERLSPATYPQDITLKLKYLVEGQAQAIAKMLTSGTAYRCRIGKGRWYFSDSADGAIAAALEQEIERVRGEVNAPSNPE